MRARTDFKGWQSEVDFEANERERVKRLEQAIEAYKQMQQKMKREDPIRPLTLKWRITIIIGAAGFGAFVLWELFTWVLDGLLKAFGR